MGPSRRTYGSRKGPTPSRRTHRGGRRGASRGAVDRRARRLWGRRDASVGTAPGRGRLHQLYPGVYAVGHTLLTPRGRWRAAVLACGPEAVLSHQSAAAFWGIRQTARRDVDVTTPQRGRKGHPGIDLHRVRNLDPQDVTVATTSASPPWPEPSSTSPKSVDDAALEKALNESEIRRLLDVRRGRRRRGSSERPETSTRPSRGCSTTRSRHR